MLISSVIYYYVELINSRRRPVHGFVFLFLSYTLHIKQMKAIFSGSFFLLILFISACSSKQETRPGDRRLLGDGFGIATATILVQNLDSARNYYTNSLGFNMPARKKFKKGSYEGTLSAFLEFADFSAIELLSINDTAVASVRPSFIPDYLKHHEGARLYSLFTSSIDSTYNWLKSQGLKPDSPQSGRYKNEKPKGWDWDDGGAQYRSLAFDNSNPSASLPVFYELVGLPFREINSAWKPYAWRKYYDNQPNGVVGMSALKIVVSDLPAATKAFDKMGLERLESNDTVSRFRVAHEQELRLVSSGSIDTAAAGFLKSRGPGVYAICFEVKNIAETQAFFKSKLPAKAFLTDTLRKHLTLAKEFACGVQLEFTEESKEQAALARIFSFQEGVKLDTASSKYASKTYIKYCSLCHGKNREGYAADFAPSLRSHSLMATTQLPRSSYNFLSHTIAYGRPGTAMAPYTKSQGGPLDEDDIDLILHWLYESSGVKKPIEMSAEPVVGNIAQGKVIYGKNCASCHGINGEGIRAPALGNPMLLATASDAFLRYTISEGRDSTPMPSFKDSLSKAEINSVTAYLRSRASGWNAPEAVSVKAVAPGNYILNPRNNSPEFRLKDNLYVSAKELLKAFKDSTRMVILDARSKAAWHQTHIPGSVSVPYYEEPEKFIKDIPKDSTWIIAYCACPHAASGKVVTTLRRLGYKHTAILDEGILVWTNLGFPVQYGRDLVKK
jgi:cbb3-type cytochrome c oxidase subunit III